MNVARPPKSQVVDGWVCPNCGNYNYPDDDHCSEIQWREAEGWVETACGAPKPDWIK